MKRVPAHVKGINFPPRAAWTPKIPDWPVIPDHILKIAAAATTIIPPPITIRPMAMAYSEPDQIDAVRLGISLMGLKPISDAEADIIGGY